MRGSLVVGVFLGLLAAAPVLAQNSASDGHSPTNEAVSTSGAKLTFTGDTALWSVAIKPDKTQDFEQVMMRLRQALQESKNPERQRQAAGWQVVRLDTPLPSGTVVYVHMIHPVVPGADYSVMQALYDAFPDERQSLYELYRNAFDRNVSLAKGTVAVDLSTPASARANLAR